MPLLQTDLSVDSIKLLIFTDYEASIHDNKTIQFLNDTVDRLIKQLFHLSIQTISIGLNCRFKTT